MCEASLQNIPAQCQSNMKIYQHTATTKLPTIKFCWTPCFWNMSMRACFSTERFIPHTLSNTKEVLTSPLKVTFNSSNNRQICTLTGKVSPIIMLLSHTLPREIVIIEHSGWACLPGERLFSSTTDSDKQGVASLLSDHTSYPSSMLDGIQEEHQIHLLTCIHVKVIQIL